MKSKTTNTLVLGSLVAVFTAFSLAFAQPQGLDDLLASEPTFEPRAGEAPAEADASSAVASTADAAEPATATVTDRAPERRRLIEEILVTAQRKEEALHDVPISMSVIDSEYIADHSISDFRELSLHVPNLQIDLPGVFIEPRIRGFTTNPVNRGFEQAVGLVFDGIPYTRPDYFDAALFDVQRIEVLRGPQGTLFGKNTTVGLLNLATNEPTDEFTGNLDLEIGDFDRRRAELGVGGPLLPGILNFRIAGLSDERDGYVENTTHRVVPHANRTFQDKQRRALRVKLEAPDLFGSNVLFTYERADVDIRGTALEFITVPEDVKDFYRRFDPDTDFIPGNYIRSTDLPELSTRVINTVVTRVRYPFDAWAIEAIAGHSILDTENFFDGDAGPAQITDVVIDDEASQTTFEIRATSPDFAGFLGLERLFGYGLGQTDFVAGFFFQRGLIDPTDFLVDIDPILLLELVGISGFPVPGGNPSPPPGSENGASREFVEHYSLLFEQDAYTYAGYGQMNWRFLDQWTVLFGSRLSLETKDAHFVSTIEPDSAFLIPTQIEEFDKRLDRSEVQFAPKVGARYDWTEEVGFYATWARGFRGGGFNTNEAREREETLRFGPETVMSWELGSKTNLLGGAARLNIGLFHMDMKDFQVNTEEAGEITPQIRIINAGKARARGVEVDFTWLPTDWLTLLGALGFNDTEYLDFPIGPCQLDEENTDGDDDPRCDLTGRSLERAPKWNSTLTVKASWPVARIPGLGAALASPLRGIGLGGRFTTEFQDSQYLDDTLDPRTRFDSFFRFDASIGLEDETRGWSLGVTVQNLTDELVASSIQEIQSVASGFTQTIEPPRTIFGGFRYQF